MIRTLIISFIVGTASAVALAQATAPALTSTIEIPKDSTPVAKSPLEIKGRLWTQYTNDLTNNSVHKNGFDIYRAYLQAIYKYDDTWSGVLLLDGQRGETATGTSGAITKAPDWAYVRNIYVQGANLWEGEGTFRFGLQPTPYIVAVDDAVRTRWLTKNLTDFTGMLQSQSAGVSAMGKAGSFMKYQVIAHNGNEGVNKTGASDNALAYAGSVTLFPFAENEGGDLKKLGVTVHDEIQTGGQVSATTSTNATNTLTAAIHMPSDFVDFALEWANQKDKVAETEVNAYGAIAHFKFLEQRTLGFFARYYCGNDVFQATKLAAKNAWAVGPTYQFIKDKVMTALLYDSKASATAGVDDTNTLMWNFALNF